MTWSFNPYSLPLAIAAGAAVLLAVYSWRLRQAPGARALAALMIGAAIWSLADAIQMNALLLPDKVIWSKASYLGTVVVPVAWLAFAVAYTGRWPLSRLSLALLSLEPAATVLIAWTNEAHGLLWSSLSLDASGPFLRLAREYGSWFWLHTTYSYLLVAAGTILLVGMAFRLRRVYAVQSAALILSVALPWAGNALYLFRLTPVLNLDLTPFAFVAAGLVMFVGLFRLQVLEVFPGLIPIARDAVVEAMREGVLVVDRQRRVVDLNTSAQRLLGCSDADIGKRADEVIEDWPKLVPAWSEECAGQYEASTGEGAAQRHFDLLLSPLRRHDGRYVGCLLVVRDITQRKRAELEREAALEQLGEANARLARTMDQAEQYVRAASHDLRAPLTVILAQSQWIPHVLGEPDRVRRAAEAIAVSARRMNSMIQDLVDAARIDAGEMVLDIAPVDLLHSMMELGDRMGTTDPSWSRRVRLVAEESLPPVLADHEQLERVLTNLLTNALKYSPPESEVTIQMGRVGDEVVTSVVDRGAGIPREDLPRLFEEYYRGEAGRERRESLGLGLSIAKKLVEAQGGRLWVESEPGKGSSFRFSLRIAP